MENKDLRLNNDLRLDKSKEQASNIFYQNLFCSLANDLNSLQYNMLLTALTLLIGERFVHTYKDLLSQGVAENHIRKLLDSVPEELRNDNCKSRVYNDCLTLINSPIKIMESILAPNSEEQNNG